MLIVFGALGIAVAIDAPGVPAPGACLQAAARRFQPAGGGAGLALAVQRFGVPARLVGAVGDDAFGDAALDRARHGGVDVRSVRYLAGRSTGLRFLISAGPAPAAELFVPGANADVRPYWIADEELAASRTLLIDATLPASAVQALARRGRHGGCRTVLALPSGLQAAPVPGSFDWVVADASALRPAGAAGGQGAAALGRRIAEAWRAPVALHLGSAGAWVSEPDGSATQRPGLPDASGAQTVDPALAFDTFAGVFTAALNQGLLPRRAADHAAAAAALLGPAGGALPPERCAIEDALLQAAALR